VEALSTSSFQLITWSVHTIALAGLCIGIGGAFFTNWISDSSNIARLIAMFGVVVGLLAVPVSPVASQNSWSREVMTFLSDVALLPITAGYCPMAQVAGSILLIGLLSLAVRGIVGKILSLAAIVLLGLLAAVAVRPDVEIPVWLTGSALFLHTIGIAIWVGALPPLAILLANSSPSGMAALARFSYVAPFAVLPVIASGVLLGLVRLETLEALWTTSYGRVLVLKLVLFAALFGIAVFNRISLTEPALQGQERARTLLRRLILLELAIAALILAVVAAWRTTRLPSELRSLL